MDTTPPLDILLYAHDGRGLGHASRTIAVGMALRRLHPSLRVLFLSGCRHSADLIGSAPLDWLKLPSYETVVENGVSQGAKGKSNFSDHHLGILRGSQIADIVKTYRPRLILADHSPQGKHKELRPALEDPENVGIRWVLGIRAVVGSVSQLSSPLATDLFQRHYTDLLWYGDSRVLGDNLPEEAGTAFNTTVRECGYVSRIRECVEYASSSPGQTAGLVSIPWFGEQTAVFLDNLHSSLEKIGDAAGTWELFLQNDHRLSQKYHELFHRLPWCSIHPPGRRYVESLMRARCAIIYGGYNSLVDVLSVPVPSLVVLRHMQDGEQQQHVEKLMGAAGELLTPIEENITSPMLVDAIWQTLTARRSSPPAINLAGAENSANHLAGLLRETL